MQARKISLIISLVANLVLGYLLYSRPVVHIESSDTKEFIEYIDSLELELSILKGSRDSIVNEIDTISRKIENNNMKHEKIRDTIISNTVSNDYIFFIKYLSKNRARLDSINNF